MTHMTKTRWWHRFFNHPDYLAIYRDMTGSERTRLELDFCGRALEWTAGEPILDAPCGAGRHTLELARRGHNATGLDVAEYLLAKAMEAAPRHSYDYPPRFARGLLQQLPFRDGSFGHVVCLFSSFGYGETEEDNLAVMREFARVARPGGKILIDVMNRHFVVPHLNKVYESVQHGLRVREERTIVDNGRRLHNRITVTEPNGARRSYLYRPWLFNGRELSLLAAKAGLRAAKLYGAFGGRAYQSGSERAMLVAIKE